MFYMEFYLVDEFCIHFHVCKNNTWIKLNENKNDSQPIKIQFWTLNTEHGKWDCIFMYSKRMVSVIPHTANLYVIYHIYGNRPEAAGWH